MNYRKLIKIDKCCLCQTDHYKYLEVDHIDSNHQNNVINNLQVLCKYCHTLKTILDRKQMGLFFSSLIINAGKDSNILDIIQKYSVTWLSEYGSKNKTKGIKFFDIKSILNNNQYQKVNKTYRYLLSSFTEFEENWNDFDEKGEYIFDKNSAIKIPDSKKTLSNEFGVFYDLSLKLIDDISWIDMIIKDKIIHNKIIFTFRNYTAIYWFKHNFWNQSYNRKIIREIIKKSYLNDYSISVKTNNNKVSISLKNEPIIVT